ncbi:polysaccharide biosynthesis C-terminal domain-containing protein [Peptococcaceae bacterium]|nr:polysaccharide biosynthesis C-terminal domain-containing protein [Peptococcaceae bacterium]
MVLLFTVPASVGLFVLSYPIIQLLFERGAFDARATDMTATALMFFSIGLAAQSVNVILTRGFYALHDTRTPVKLTFIAVFINLILSLSLIGPLQHGGLALATSIAAIINTLMLSKFLSKRMQGLWDKSVLYFCLKIGIASMLMLFFKENASFKFCFR